MKKLYSLLFALLAFAGVAGAQVVFDFTGDTAYEQFGLTGFSSGSGATYVGDGDIVESASVASNGVTITVSKSGTKDNNRMWKGSLRVYGGTLTIASSSENISSVKFNLNNSKWGAENSADSGTLTTGQWTGSAQTVVITISANTQIKSIEVTLGEGGENPDPDPDPQPTIDWTSSLEAPLTVAQALEKAAQLAPSAQTDVKVYVKGKISRITDIDGANSQGVPYGNATYYISDNGEEANELQVFRGKGLNGNNISSADIKVGDEVIVVGYIKNYVENEVSTFEFTQNSELAAINGEGAPVEEVTVYNKIADVKAAATADHVKVAFQATNLLVTYVNGKSVYVYDGTDGLLLFANNAKLAEGIKAGDKITAKFSGQLYLYNGLTEIAFEEVADLAVNSSNNAVEPQKVTIADVNNNQKDYENELIQIEGLTAQAEGLENRNIAFMDDSDNEITVRDNWNVLTTATFNTSTPYSVTAFVAIYNGAVQLYPRTVEDIDNGEAPVEYEFTGDGSFENPYTVEDMQHIVATSTSEAVQEDAWVKAYIVGYINGSSLKTETAMFTAEAPEGVDGKGEPLKVSVSNILIADAPSADAVADVIPVALVAKNLARTDLNLADNPDKLGAQVWLKGNVVKYMGVTGLKEVKEYSLDGQNITIVNAVKADAAKGAIYNIAGQRVSVVGKGLYVVGNKKVLAE